jgi:hypothetical protein
MHSSGKQVLTGDRAVRALSTLERAWREAEEIATARATDVPTR